MDWVGLFTRIDGRISRQPFWLGVLVLGIVEVAMQFATDWVNNERISAALDLIVAYPEFAVAVKRGHDRNVPTWVVATFFALGIMTDLLTLAGYGLDRETQPVLFYAIALPLGLFALVLLIDFGFRRGTQGENRYGPDPLAAGP
jgi:uncharacterized membrane protein YhaH (DUF805 family)